MMQENPLEQTLGFKGAKVKLSRAVILHEIPCVLYHDSYLPEMYLLSLGSRKREL
jgi:hypothetical protein